MNLRLAAIISFVLNPMFILLLLPFFLVQKTTNSFVSATWWTGYTAFFLLILGSFMIYGVRKGIFTDMDVSRREQRPLIFSFGLILAAVYIGGLYLLKSPLILKVVAIGIMIGTIIVSFVNTRIKASLHIATFAALLMGLSLGYGAHFLVLYLFLPVLAQSRISLKRHTLTEIIVGGILGSLITLGMYAFLRIFIYKY